MAKNTTPKLIRELERVFGAMLYDGPVKAAERVVTELQQEGPSWTGQYSNSWQIEAAGTVVKGNGRGGNPRPLKVPNLTVKQKRSLRKNKVVISNFSTKAGYAQDEIVGRFRRGVIKQTGKKIGVQPRTSFGKGKFEENSSIGRGGISRRGDIGSAGPGVSSRTAPLDWYTTYLKGCKLDRAVRVETNKAIKKNKGGGV